MSLDAEPQLPFEVDLLNREVLDRDMDGELRVTLYGLLCFGKDPQGHGPTRNHWVDLVAYSGTDRADAVLLAGEAKGRLDEQVQRAEGWLRSLAARRGTKECNAQTSGPFQRPESVLAGGSPRSRNEAMANLLLDLGLMEQRGSGYPRIARAMSSFNGSAPELLNERDERWVRVTLRRTP